MIYILKGLLPGVVLGCLTLIILSAKDIIITGFIESGYSNADSINTVFLYVVGALYVASIIVLAIGLLVNLLHYIGCRFNLDTYAFRLRRGIFSRDDISIPYRQIQDVDVDQSVLGRLFGIGKLIILTAGNNENNAHGEESEVVFGIVDISVAKYLQKALTEKSSIQLVKNA